MRFTLLGFFRESYSKSCEGKTLVEINREACEIWKKMPAKEQWPYILQAQKVDKAYSKLLHKEEIRLSQEEDDEVDSGKVTKGPNQDRPARPEGVIIVEDSEADKGKGPLVVLEEEELAPLNFELPPSLQEEEFKYDFERQVPEKGPEDSPKPYADPYMGLNAFVAARLSQRTKDRMAAEGGKYMPNVVCTLRFPTSSGSSCPSDPKTTIFPVPISDEKAEEDYLDEEGSISGSKRFSADAKKKMIKGLVKMMPDEFKDSHKSLQEAYVGPIMGAMAESLVRLDQLAKKVRADKKENKRSCHGSASLSLNKKTEQCRVYLQRLLEKDSEIEMLKKQGEENVSKQVEEDVARRMEEARASIRVKLTQEFQSQLDAKTSEVGEARVKIAELESKRKLHERQGSQCLGASRLCYSLLLLAKRLEYTDERLTRDSCGMSPLPPFTDSEEDDDNDDDDDDDDDDGDDEDKDKEEQVDK
ncbi:HMG1/2-like protein [Bienertia sinuspersici]